MDEHNQNCSCGGNCQCSGGSFHPHSTLKLVALLVVGAIVIVSIIRDRIVNQPQAQVSVAGVGKVAYQADQANITLGVQVDRVYDAASALRQLNDKVSKVVAAVKAAGVAEADIETQNYTLYPQYAYQAGASIPNGYSANQQLSVKVRKLGANNANVSAVVAAATQAGANQVTGIAFDVSNLSELKQQARLTAIADAKAKAGVQAKAAGVTLGEVMGWWENVIQSPDSQAYVAAGDSGKGGAGGAPTSTPTVPSGSQEIIIEVSLNYKID